MSLDTTANEGDAKQLKICSVNGGLDVTRLVSTRARSFFGSAISDVEFIREYIAEVAAGASYQGGFQSLSELSQTLDWEARGMAPNFTTRNAELGFADDRPNRRMDRYASANPDIQPMVGDKQSDFDMLDSVSAIFPWVVDSKAKEASWKTAHQVGRSEGEKKEPFLFDSLYTAAWTVSYAGAVVYYPPLAVYGHPLTMGDIVGDQYDPRAEPFVVPSLPENNPERLALFTKPYPDTAIPGLSLITALAPVYFTGAFQGHRYNDTYIGATGVDIAVSSVSSYLDLLQDTLTRKSFGVLVDSEFNTIVISEDVVKRIYPERTGFEEERITYGIDGSIVQDRRNQTYLPSDTILQDLTKLKNADWEGLRTTVRDMSLSNDRGFTKLNISLTGEKYPTEFYVMYDHWANVADWTLLVFAPTAEVEGAIDISVVGKNNSFIVENADVASLEGQQGDILLGRGAIKNTGALDLIISPKTIPSWIDLKSLNTTKNRVLKPGEVLSVEFDASTAELNVGTLSTVLVFDVEDADYPDCFFRKTLNLQVSVRVTPKSCSIGGQVRDADGRCVCDASTVPVGSSCLKIYALVLIVVLPMLMALVAIYIFAARRRRKAEDSIWKIKRSDLKSADPVKVIGEGGFGMVFLAEYRGTQVAVKKMRETSHKGSEAEAVFVDTDEASESGKTINSGSQITSVGSFAKNHSGAGISNEDFVREMRVLSAIRHPNVTTVMGAVVEKDSAPLLVMEYMDRGSLYDLIHIEKVEFEAEMLLSMLRDITQGVQFLHNMNPPMIHGDLKSTNILVDSRFRAKIADFGTTTINRRSRFVTGYFMAPELLRKESPFTVSSDAYSFGMVLNELYNQRIPYQGEDPNAVLRDICDLKIQKRPPVPACMKFGVRRIMTACLSEDPKERPLFDEIASDFRGFDPSQVESKRGEKHLDVLLKSFPQHIAEALCDGRKIDPVNHPNVTVVCCEVVDFAKLSAELPPEKTSGLVCRLFEQFDKLSQQHDVHSVETGAATWMGVTNCVKEQEGDHTKRVAEFCFDAVQAAESTLVDPEVPSLGHVQVQFGFHSGQVLSNIIGSRNPRFALFGETVNKASLTAKSAEPGRITCTLRTSTLLKVQAPDFEREPRGKLHGLTFYVNPPPRLTNQANANGE